MAFVLKNIVGGTLTVHFVCVPACSASVLKLPILKKTVVGNIIITLFRIPSYSVRPMKDPFQYHRF